MPQVQAARADQTRPLPQTVPCAQDREHLWTDSVIMLEKMFGSASLSFHRHLRGKLVLLGVQTVAPAVLAHVFSKYTSGVHAQHGAEGAGWLNPALENWHCH